MNPNRAKAGETLRGFVNGILLAIAKCRRNRVPEHYRLRARFIVMSIEGDILSTEAMPGSRAVALCDAHSGDGLVTHLQSIRNDSSFVAHLIATADNLPQTRHRRRAEPRDALAAYTLTRSLPPDCRSTRRVA